MSDIVFVHSGFRTGSSWLRDKFRAADGTLVFGEVFHEMLAVLDAETAMSLAPGSWNSRHPEAAPYFLEYVPLLRSEGGIAAYSEEMAFERYFPKGGRLSDEERHYIELLIKHARKMGRSPVFSCTRTMGRMKQLKDAFGGKHILLTRDPFQQWCSYTEHAANGNPYFLRTNELILKSALDASWLNLGNPAAAADFMSLESMHKHLILHLKIYSEIAAAADLVVNYELLESEEYRDECRRWVSAECGFELDLSDFHASNQFSLVELPSERVLDETIMPFLPSRDAMHAEVLRLHDSMRGSMRSYAGQAGKLVTFTRRKLGDLAQAKDELESVGTHREAATAELEQALGAVDALRNELTAEQSRSAEVYSRLTAAEKEAENAREAAAAASMRADEAHRGEAEAVTKMAEAAQHYAAQIQALSSDHGRAQDELRRELAQATEDVRERLRESQASDSAARIELARLEERTANLESTVARLSIELQSSSAASDEAAANWSRKFEEQSATLAEARAALGRAAALITAAREAQPSRWKLLGQALGFSRPPQSWRALFSWKFPAAGPVARSPQDEAHIDGKEQTMNSSGSTESRNPYLRADSLPQLLLWDDVNFVRCAYVTVLGRQPDPMGEAHFTNRIRMGDSKYAVLWQLRKSDEARYHDPGIAGFDRALRREALRRNRLFGWLIRAALPGEGASRQDRRFRQLRNMLAIIGSQQSQQSDAAAAIKIVGAELAAGLERISANLAQMSEQIAANSTGGEEGALRNCPQLVEQVRLTDDLDLSSRERAVLRSIQSAR
jgi:hypothetical protein